MASTTPCPPFSLTAPFTRRTLNGIRSALAEHFAVHDTEPSPGEPHAAVLAPFCNVNDRPGILLEVRGRLRTHSGEVRWVRIRSPRVLRPHRRRVGPPLAFPAAE